MATPTTVSLKPKYPTIHAGESLVLTASVSPKDVRPSHLVIWDAGGLGAFTAMPGTEIVVSQAHGYIASYHPPRLDTFEVLWETAGITAGRHRIGATVYSTTLDFGRAVEAYETGGKEGLTLEGSAHTTVQVLRGAKEPVSVTMRRAESPATADQALWTAIRDSANALSFENYDRFMEVVLCGGDEDALLKALDPRETRWPVKHRLKLPFPDTDAYRQLKVATEVFVMLNCGVFFDDARRREVERDPEVLAAESRRYYQALQPGDIENYWTQFLEDVETEPGQPSVPTLPYLAIIRRKLQDVAVVQPKGSRWLQQEEAATECMGILMRKLTHPCLLELIWSYWHEEGMLVQTMNAITWRFQNRRGPADRDPLALLEIDPLRPLNNFIWGYIQDEQHRLTVPRRAYEYDHHYGLTLLGKAVPTVRGADSRSRFLEGFHNLLFRCSLFFKEDDDTTVVADGFPVLNALKEVHLQLTQGAHNQYGDLPWTARQEMLMQEWLLARPEMREFLPSRVMVDYPEPWMDRVETMKTLQGWTDTSVMHFRDLGVFGEQVLLSVRFGAWPSVIEPQSAANWARYWRPEIQGYIHAYRAVTGVDLTERIDATMPAVLLRQRLAPARGAALPPAAAVRIASRVGQLPSRAQR